MAGKVIINTGKRKKAIARAVLKEGKGRVTVNNIPLEVYEPFLAKLKIMEPLSLSGIMDKVDISVTVEGGGVMGQAEAARTSIGKCLVEYTGSKDLRKTFYGYDRSMVKDDTRRKETKKYGGRGARVKRQKSYR